jgi:reductive dehalogenase
MTKSAVVNRREFMGALGLAAVSIPAGKVVGTLEGDPLMSSREAYGGFLVRKLPKGKPPYTVDDERCRRFDQRNETFSRGRWDPSVIEAEKPFRGMESERMKNEDLGFTRLDYAFYMAAWTVGSSLGTGAGTVGGSHGGLYSWKPLGGMNSPLYGLARWKPADWTLQEVTDIIKKAALFYGASLCGVAELDERWIYSHRFTKQHTDPPNISAPIIFDDVEEPEELGDRTLVIPRSMKYVIALAFEMDYDGFATVPGGPGSAATGNGYSRMAFTAPCLAELIRGLGYNAIPCGNCTGQSIPIAIDAGLGELGRMGVLITPKYGPRVRLAKVITDMPLLPDHPISFGVTEFCEVCGKCAEHCPGDAVSETERTYEPLNVSNRAGIFRWPVDGPKCHLVWRQTGMDCAICLRVCPFNKPEGWVHEAARILIGSGIKTLDELLLKLDDASAYGEQSDPREFWRKRRFVHIKG